MIKALTEKANETLQPHVQKRLLRISRIAIGLGTFLLLVNILARGYWPILAGIAGIILLASLHELGHFIAARRSGMQVTEVGFGIGPILASRCTKRNIRMCWRAIPLAAYVKIPGMVAWETTDVPEERTYRAASTPKRLLVASAGIVANILVAFVLLVVAATMEPQVVGGVAVVTPGTTSLPSGTVVRGIETPSGVDFLTPTPTAFHQMLAQLHASRLALIYNHNGHPVTRSVTVEPGGRFGWEVPGLTVTQATRHVGPFSSIVDSLTAIVAGSKQLATASSQMVTPTGLATFAHQIAKPHASPQAKRPVSIVGIVDLAASAARHSLWAFLSILALVSLALGLFNLLPVPPLDGGYIAIAVYESLRSTITKRGYRISRPAYSLAATTTVVILTAMSAAAIYLDIVAPIKLHLPG